jgi:hypothetical protein
MGLSTSPSRSIFEEDGRLMADVLRGDKPKAQMVYFWAYLWPEIFEHVVPGRLPGPRFRDPFAVDCNLAAVALGPDPDPQVRLGALIELRDGLTNLTRKLNADIKELKG